MAKEVFLKEQADTLALGNKLARGMKAGSIVLLYGDLGAGKTCFVRGVASFFSQDAAESVSSPTFALMNIYEAGIPIYHFDMYRLGDGDALDAGFDEYIFGGGISLIEWPEAALDMLDGESYSVVSLEYAGEDGESRKAWVSGALEEYV